MEVRADLHNHLTTLSRGIENLNFSRIVDLSYERLGDNGILGVINFGDRRYEKFSEKRGYERIPIGNVAYTIPEKGNLIVVRGEEVPTKQGHLLILGLKKPVKWKRGIEETLKEIQEEGGIAIADHPFGRNGVGEYLKTNLDCMDLLDGIETWNGETPPWENQKAWELYIDSRKSFPNLGALNNSDGHSPSEIASSYTKITDIKSRKEEGFISELKKEVQTSIGIGRKKYSIYEAFQHASILGAHIGLTKVGIDLDKRHR